MKFEFDEFNFKDQIDLININKQINQSQIKQNLQTFGFNNDKIYTILENEVNE